MFVGLLLAVFVQSVEDGPQLSWDTPENCAWHSISLNDDDAVPFEVSWTEETEDPAAFPEYQIDVNSDSATWYPFPGWDRNLVQRDDQRRYFKGNFRAGQFGRGRRGFIRGRWRTGARYGPSRAAYYNRGAEAVEAPIVDIQGQRYPIPGRRGWRRARAGPRFARFPLRIRSRAPLVAVLSRVGPSGQWRFVADVVPETDTTIHIPQSEFPEANPGEVIPVQFKAFDGMKESAVTEPLNAVVNHPPVLNVNGEAEPVIHDYGRKIEMPFQIADTDGDPVTLFYKFDNAGEWSELPASTTPNILPGSIFADLDPTVQHRLDVLAFDGYDESEPVPYFKFDWLRKARRKVVIVAKKAAPIVIRIGAIPPNGGPFGSWKTPVRAGIIGLDQINSFAVSHSIDDGEWSEPVMLPLGEHHLFNLEDLPTKYLSPGAHTFAVRCGDESTRDFSMDDASYYVNSAPSVQLTDDKPLSFKSTSTNPVPVPISVSDVDGDPITVFYRFQGDETWSHLPTANGEYVLPADAFSDRLTDGNGAVEIFAWDGVEKSGDALKIPYATVVDAAEPEANEAPIAEDSNLFGDLSPAAFVGITVGGVAVIAIVVGIILFTRRDEPESSSTGLIKDE